MIDPVIWWFEITPYGDKKTMMIAKLVENMWLVRYPCLVEIIYYQGVELLSHKFKNSLIKEEYFIKTNPDPPGTPRGIRKPHTYI